MERETRGFTSVLSPIAIYNHIDKEDKVVCKRPSSSSLLTEEELQEAYKRETRAYQEILPSLGVSWMAAKFYASSSGLIILQDLVDEGFSSADRLGGLSPGQMDLALEALADLHASSLVLRATDRQQWDLLTSALDDIRVKTSTFHVWLEISLEKAIAELATIKENVADILASSPPKATIPSSNSVFQVICHGDYWSNNLMFQKEQSIRIVDFQNMSCGPLYRDLLTLLSTSFRIDTDVLSCYKKYFGHLSRLAAGVSQLPSYEELLAHLREGFGYGFRMGLLYLGARLGEDHLQGAYRTHLMHLIRLYRNQGFFQT